MYKVIGGDGRQYGPITDMEMRQWIGEGRLNAQSLARAEGDAEFRPLSTFPEFADALGSAAPVSEGPASHAPAVDWSARDYELDIGGCISQGWNLFKNNVGILLGSSALYLLILFFVSLGVAFALNMVFASIISKETLLSPAYKTGYDFIFRALSALVFGPLTGGIYYIFIQTMRGQPADIGRLFIGFQKSFLQLFVSYLVFTFLYAVCLIPYNFTVSSRMGPLLIQIQHSPTPQQMQALIPQILTAFTGTFPILLACLLPVIYLSVGFQFVQPLIVDKGVDFLAAIKISWKMVHKHWLTVFGLFFLTTLIFIAGCFVCCVGAFFTFPISTAALMFAYETIFGQERASSNL